MWACSGSLEGEHCINVNLLIFRRHIMRVKGLCYALSNSKVDLEADTQKAKCWQQQCIVAGTDKFTNCDLTTLSCLELIEYDLSK